MCVGFGYGQAAAGRSRVVCSEAAVCWCRAVYKKRWASSMDAATMIAKRDNRECADDDGDAMRIRGLKQ
jgi:hypothetical protein